MSSDSDVFSSSGGGGTSTPSTVGSNVVRLKTPAGWKTVCENPIYIRDGVSFKRILEGDRIYYDGSFRYISCGIVTSITRNDWISTGFSIDYRSQKWTNSLTVNANGSFSGSLEFTISAKVISRTTSAFVIDEITLNGTSYPNSGVGVTRSRDIIVNVSNSTGYTMNNAIVFEAEGPRQNQSEHAEWDIELEISYIVKYKNRVVGSDTVRRTLSVSAN